MKRGIFVAILTILIIAVIIWVEYQIAVSELPDWVKYILLK